MHHIPHKPLRNLDGAPNDVLTMMAKMLDATSSSKKAEEQTIERLENNMRKDLLRFSKPLHNKKTRTVEWPSLTIGVTGGRGNNLIAKHPMPAGCLIPIMGKLRTSSNMHGGGVRGTHVWQMQGRGLGHVYIDGSKEDSRGANVAMMANEPNEGDEEKQNAILRHNCLITMRHIKRGEEILTDYGHDYHRTYPHDGEEAKRVMDEWGQTEAAGEVDQKCRKHAMTIRKWVMAQNFLHNIDELRYKKANVRCYAVLAGRTTGVFECWECVRISTDKFSNAEQRGFGSRRDAAEYLCREQGALKSKNPAKDWGAGLAVFNAINETTSTQLPDEVIHRIVLFLTYPHDFREEDTRRANQLQRCPACEAAARERAEVRRKKNRGAQLPGPIV
jgi:hypothetical protein